MKKMGLKFLAVMAIAALSVVPVFAKQTVIEILHTNDTHANVKDNGKDSIGFAKFASFIEAEKAEGNVLVLDAGDMFQGLPFANLENGHSIIEIVNQVGYDAMTIGNHEFDFGSENLFDIIGKLNYKVLAANLMKDGVPVTDTYIVKEFDGVKVGVFGMSTPETAFKTHPDNVVGYTFEDIIKTAEDTIKILEETEKVDIILMVSHLGLDEGDYTSDLVAKGVEGIDVIVDGHSHTTLEQGRLVNDTLIVSTGSAFKNVGKVEITVTDGVVTSKVPQLLDYSVFTEVEPNAVIVEAITKVEEGQKPLLEKVVGKAAMQLVGERTTVRTGESNLGQLATDAMLDLTGAQMAITNGGGIRASIEAGDITMNDMVTVFPFGNTIMVKEMKGIDIQAALEYGTSEYPNEKGAFPHTAGITFTLNAAAEAGNRVSDIKIEGEALDLEKMYTVATNDFMAVGGDGYNMFTAYPIKAEYNTLMDTLLSYVEKLGTVEGIFEVRMNVITEAQAEKTSVELRAYLEEQGFKVSYESATKVIKAEKESAVLTFKVNDATYTVTNKEVKIEGRFNEPLSLENNVTVIPVNEVKEAIASLKPAA